MKKEFKPGGHKILSADTLIRFLKEDRCVFLNGVLWKRFLIQLLPFGSIMQFLNKERFERAVPKEKTGKKDVVPDI